jgi:hypothetical protein
MWAMADRDGRDVAEHYYKSIFLVEMKGFPTMSGLPKRFVMQFRS